jgi:hypothetical protein
MIDQKQPDSNLKGEDKNNVVWFIFISILKFY